MNIVKVVEQTIKTHNMLNKGDRVLVGLSGGSDSVALLVILCTLAPKYDLTIAAAHINHMLRDTADRDMEYCRKLCESLKIEFFCKKVDIHNEAKSASMSDELYARKVRYDFFDSFDFNKIATAHNKNDSAETILFHFIRGASPHGLCGIPYKRGNIIRPLLDVKKTDINDFCKKNDITYMTDETNLEQVYSRNKLRLSVIPLLEKEFNPSFTDVITANSTLFEEDSRYLDSLAAKSYNKTVTKDSLLSLDICLRRRVIELHYKNSAKTSDNLPISYVNDILELVEKGISGSKIDLPNGYEAGIEYEKLIIGKKIDAKDFEYKIYPETVLKIPEIGKNLLISPSPDPDIFLDTTDGLSVRNRRKGDIFYPIGMTGKKKLSDYFTDKKIPLSKRDSIPILTQNGEIIGILGYRYDRRFCDKSKKGYKIELKETDNAK